MELIQKAFSLEQVDFDPFAPLPICAPSTEAQREIFVSVKLGGKAANCAYNESVSLKFSGFLNTLFLQKSFDLLMDRHNALRSSFSEDGTQIHIAPKVQVTISINDLQKKTETEKENFIQQIKEQEVHDEFDLENGPLIRARILILSDQSTIFIVTAHHIICDGWSLSLLLQDLGKIYSALVENLSPVLPSANNFAEFAEKQDQYQKEGEYSQTESYWLNQFAEEIPQLDIPIDKLRPSFRTFNAHRIDVPVPVQTVADLRELAKKTNTSFVTIMLSILETFLYKVTGQKELVVGLPSSGQSAEGLYNLVGHCVNLLPIRTSLDPQMTFLEYLKERRGYLFDAFDHQQFTFGNLVRKLNINRDPSRIPLVPVVLNVDIGFTDGFQFSGLTFDFSTNPRFYENFELFLNASGNGNNLLLECTYNIDLFETSMMELRMQEFIHVMQQVITNSTQQIAKISAMTTKEQVVLSTLNLNIKDYPTSKGIHELFSEKATLFPNRIATSSNANSYSYSRVDRLSTAIAAQLQQRGVKPGDFVGVCLPRVVELPMVLLAIMKTGAAYVPLDPNFPADRLRLMLDDSQAGIVIATKKLAADLELTSEQVFYFDEEELKNFTTDLFVPVPFSADQLAYVLYTSGSTGKPKGVMVKHSGVVNLMTDLQTTFNFKPEDTLLAITTISFDISVLEFFLPLLSGAGVHLATREQAMDATWLDKTIQEYPITYMQGTPATWELLLTSGWRGAKHLTVLCGGEALRVELAEKLFGKNLAVWNLYGPTETTIWSTIKKIEISDFHNTRNGGVSIGKAVANTQLYIVDEFGQPCPLGVAGELWIGGDGVSTGYLNRPELNAEKFIPNTFTSGMIYRTGDRVSVDTEGNLHFLNRLDHQVKIRGYRIELGEIEAALNKSPGIRQGVVVARQNQSGDNFLAAYFIAETNGIEIPKLDLQKKLIQASRESMSSILPDYMIPTAWMLLDKFPLTPNDKIDRKALPDPQINREITRSNVSEESFSKIEKIIADVWKQILNVQEIALDDDFFKLGGHSLLAVRMMVDLEHITGIKLPLAVLFTNPTIGALSKLYETPPEDLIWNPLVIIKETGSRKPLYFSHGISGNVFKYHALAQLLDNDQPSYGLQAIGLNGKDEPLSVMEDIAAHHVKEIISFQPEGPYALAGGSFGGYLAYEMALQLRALGKEVSFLCLFDLDAASELEFLSKGMKQIKGAQLFAQRFVKRAVSFISADKEERQKYLQAKMRNKSKQGAGNVDYDLESWLDKHKMVELIGEESAAYFRNIEEACYKAMTDYKIKKYDRDITLIRAQEGYFNNTYAHDLGWKHFTSGKVDVHVVPGDHNSIFWEPNVFELAKTVNKPLNHLAKKK